MKKLSLKSLFMESDLLKQDKQLNAALQQIPKLFQHVMSSTQVDKYESAIQGLEQLETVVRSAKNHLKAALQKKQENGTNQQQVGSQNISNKEI